jgi:glutaredoxin
MRNPSSWRAAGALIFISSSSFAFSFAPTGLPPVSTRAVVARLPGSSRTLLLSRGLAAPGRVAARDWGRRARFAPAMNLFGSMAKGLGDAMRGGAGGGPSVASVEYMPRSAAFVQAAPSWDEITGEVLKTEVGKRFATEKVLREKGEGPPHTNNKMRLFGKKEEDVRVVLYRDNAAWCPYCQKVWLLLEEKGLPYKIEKINMRSYGEKPDWFLAKMPRGLLPVVEIDGKMVSESVVIMQLIDQLDPDLNPMLPSDKAELNRCAKMHSLPVCGRARGIHSAARCDPPRVPQGEQADAA